MLCQICHNGLEGIHDPSKTDRLGLRSDVLSYDPFSQGDPNKDRRGPWEPEPCVFGHHKTLASFQHSIAQGCIMCNRFGPKDVDIDYNELFERLGYFSVFTVSLGPGQSQLKMSVHYGDTLGGFVLVPYSENDLDIIQTLPASTKDEETWTTIQIWLNRCDEKHTFCRPSPNVTLPNWLLQLRDPLMPNASVRLIQGSTLSPETPYMTLSHCGELGHKTLLSNSKRQTFHDWQPLSQLPTLYREACEAAARAGGSHMWIEDLCNYGPENCTSPLIPSARRAQRTAAFRRSTLAIAALSTTDSLFASRNPADIVATIVNVPIGPDRTTVPHVFELDRSWSWTLTLQKEPLLRSPQFVVDRLLAPRMLLFGSKQVFWECGAACACELHPDPRSTAMAARTGGRGYDEKKRLFKPTLDMSFYRKSEVVWRQMLLDWYRVVEVYSAKDFGLAGDDNTGIPNGKLSGLTDIAVQVEAAVTREGFSSLGRYIAGHWQGTLPGSLGWTAKRPGHRSISTSMPSWSWASLDAPVTFHVSDEESSQVTLLPKLVSVSAGGSAGSDDGGSGTIALQGRLARASLLPPEEQDEEQIRGVGEGFRMVASLEGEHKTVHNRARTAVWGAIFDTKEDVCDQFSVLLMTIQPNAPYRLVSWLALVPISGSGTNDGVYRRIGTVTIEGPETHLSEADHSEVVAFVNELVERKLYLQ